MSKTDKIEYPKSVQYADEKGQNRVYHFSYHEIGDKVTARGEAFIVVGRQPTGEWVLQREVLWGPLEIEKRNLESGQVLGPTPLPEDNYIDSVQGGWVMRVTDRPLVPLEEAIFGTAETPVDEDEDDFDFPGRSEWQCDCGTINDSFDDNCFYCGDDRYAPRGGGGPFWGW
jgi:hypothetical protein